MPLIFIFRIILIESIKYWPILVNIVEKNRISNSKNENKRKNRNKLVKILTKLKSGNLFKSRFENLL